MYECFCKGGARMIFVNIDRKIKDMKKLRRLELIKANQAQQAATDTKFRTLVTQVCSFSDAIEYARENLSFSISDSIQTDMLSLLENLKGAVSTGYADKEAVVSAEADFKLIQTNTKKEWGKHFVSYTSTTTNTLKVISGIDSERINSCIAEIKAAENWAVDISVLKVLKQAIDSADSLIKDLNMDQETVLFLTKMTSGKATIADLNENVLDWIKKESLGSKRRSSK